MKKWGSALMSTMLALALLPASAAHAADATSDQTVSVISNLTDGPDPYAPEMTQDSSKITFSLTTPAVLTVEVFDKMGQWVRTLHKDASFAVGNHVVSWNGRHGSGVTVTEGTYTYKISGKDSTGNALQAVSGTITVDRGERPVVAAHSFSTMPFRPSQGPGTVSYTLNKDANVTVYIVSSSGTVATLEDNAPKKAGVYNLTWDGKGETGFVPNDTYSYFFRATDAHGFIGSGSGHIKLNNESPVYNVKGPSGVLKLTETTRTTLAYSIAVPTKVTLQIVNSSNNTVVRTLESETPRQAGTYSVLWDGRNDAGQLVQDGYYSYNLYTPDSAGVLTKQAFGRFQTDKSAPVFSNLIPAPSLFTANGRSLMEVKYNLNEVSKVTLGIYNSSNVLVRTLVSTKLNQAGGHSEYWDGRDSTGALVPVGSYVFRLLATDLVGHSRSASGVFKVGLSHAITDVRDINDPLRLTGTTASTIYYTLTQASKVTINVYDSKYYLVRTLLDSSAQTAGPKAVAWNGKNSLGQLVPEGTYTYTIRAISETGGFAPEVTGTITTDKTAPTVTNLTATPNLFDTKAGGELTLKYDLNEKAKVTIGIYNASGVLVRTLASAVANNAGTNTVKWDGKDNAGVAASNGAYSVRILATDLAGLSRNAQGSFKVDSTASTPPVISSVRDINDPLKVTGTTASTIYYTLSQASNVSIKLYDGNGLLVRTLLDNSAQTTGSKAAAWNGKDDAGLLVEDGIYTYKINAVNAHGLAAEEVIGSIKTDKNAPIVTGLTATPSPYSPTQYGELSINYNLNEEAKVTVSIYNSSNVLVRTITSAVLTPAGSNAVVWDGRDNTGVVVPNGAYSYRILATDLVGLSRSVQGVVKVESL